MRLIVPLNGLRSGVSDFHWQIGGEFFEGCENEDIRSVDLKVCVQIEKFGGYFGVDCQMEGSVVVGCDRCLADLTLPVKEKAMLSIKFGERVYDDGSPAEIENDGREVIYIPFDSVKLDLSRVVFDYVLLSLPMRKVHEKDGCASDVVDGFCGGFFESDGGVDSEGKGVANKPFAALGSMLKAKYK